MTTAAEHTAAMDLAASIRASLEAFTLAHPELRLEPGPDGTYERPTS